VAVRERHHFLGLGGLQVRVDDLLHGAHPVDGAVFQHHGPLAEGEDGGHVVRDHEHRAALARYVAHLAQAFLLERGVADREDLVNEENLRLQVRGHGKGEPQMHAARVTLDRRIDESSTSAKATISSNLRLISACFMPRMAPLR